MLIFNFFGKKYPLFTASQQDFQKIKIPASNIVWQFFASQHKTENDAIPASVKQNLEFASQG